MGRLIPFPVGLRIYRIDPLSGPRTVGGAATESLEGYVQTASGVFGLLRIGLSIRSQKDAEFRGYRGFVTALHGGANATVIQLCDWDRMTFAEMGLSVTAAEISGGVPWSDDQSWSDGQNWAVSPPIVEAPDAAAKGAAFVSLPDVFWGRRLTVGDRFGFGPDHLGWYTVTEVRLGGEVRIWPPLRRAVTAADYATLEPLAAFRLEGEGGANLGRDVAYSDELSLTMIEVEDADVRAFFDW